MKNIVEYLNESQVYSKNGNKFIDLGLPSGTMWSESTEDGFYTFNEAVKTFGNSLPTREQFEELKNQCKWKWNRNGYKVTGPNGNTIFLSADGCRSRNNFGHVSDVGTDGYYWSSTPEDFNYAWRLYFDSSSIDMYDSIRGNGLSVILVENK